MRFKTMEKTVENVLRIDKAARNSDAVLIADILIMEGHEDLAQAVLKIYEKNILKFETVRRCRQKIQAKNEDLRADKEVAEERIKNEERYREYALEGANYGR